MMQTLRADCAKEDVTSDLSGIYMKNGTRGTLESKHFEALDMVFSFVGAF